jgi:biopolymer transport protein ExbD
MPLKTSQVEELPGLNLTSMIDVVFLLLIFFMVATKFSESQQPIGVKLSGGAGLQALVAAPDQRNVNVARDGSLTLDGQPVSLNELTDRVRSMHAQYPGLVVGVNGDPEASHQTVMTAMRAVTNAANVEVRVGVKMR